MKRSRLPGAVTGTFGTGLAIAAVCLLFAPSGAAPQGTGQVKGDVGRFFFSPSSGAERGGPDRWGVPRLDSQRDDRRRDPAHRVNVRTIAGQEPVFEKPDRRPHHRKRPRVRRRPVRSVLPWVVQVTNVHVHVDDERAAAPPRKKAVRRSDAARNRRIADAEEERAAGEAARADADRPGPRPDASRAGGVEERAPAEGRSPLVLVPPESDAPERGCALVKVRTPAGITWSHRVSLDALGVSSISGASSLLRSEIGRGTPLEFRGGEGQFTVPGSRVESLTVGPCI